MESSTWTSSLLVDVDNTRLAGLYHHSATWEWFHASATLLLALTPLADESRI